MTFNKRATGSDPQKAVSEIRSTVRSRLWRWLSTVLIVVGLLLLGSGGLIAYQNSMALVEPPPPVGEIESLLPASLEGNPLPEAAEARSSIVSTVEAAAPPSLEQNPLPFISEDGLSDPSVMNVNPVSAPSSLPAASSASLGSESAGADQAIYEAMRQAEGEVPSGPPSPSVPDSVPAAAGPPTRIVAPAINLDSPVVTVGWKQILQSGKLTSVWEVAAYAAGWHKNSALPGAGGNVVLSGHHNTKGEVFRYIIDLDPGDTVTLYVGEQPYTYTVESRFVVRDKGATEEKRRQNAQWIGPFPDERLTLVTCWPYTSNTHRVIVIAKGP